MRERAVVIGASMAGLTAARLLVDHFAAVTVLDRDHAPDEPAARKGVPQGRHPHALLAGGQQALSALFPDLVDDLVADGALHIDAGRHARWFQGGGYRCCFASSVKGVLMTRPLLEHHVRRAVANTERVTLRDGVAVRGLAVDRTGVNGVETDVEGTLDADLVVDCSGRNTRSLDWLAEQGFPMPMTTTIEVGIGYTSRFLRRCSGDLRDEADHCVVINHPPDQKRLGVLLPCEDDRWILTLGGFFGDHAPRDDGGFAAFARSLPAPDIAEVIDKAEALTEPTSFRYPRSQRRHFEKVDRLPRDFVALGDAACSFNPIYGQGMSSAVLQATALGTTLEEVDTDSDELPRRFYREAAKIVSNPWQIAAGADFAYPDTVGKRAPGTNQINWYLGHVFRAAHTSPEVGDKLIRVAHLLEPPTALMTPPMMTKVFAASRRSPSRSAGALAEPVVHP